MEMVGRVYNPALYRFGFNGKEDDNEVEGQGNEYNYGFRIYNPRLGRFLSVDPLTAKYSHLTPYQYASDNPITGIDRDGREFESFMVLWTVASEGRKNDNAADIAKTVVRSAELIGKYVNASVNEWWDQKKETYQQFGQGIEHIANPKKERSSGYTKYAPPVQQKTQDFNNDVQTAGKVANGATEFYSDASTIVSMASPLLEVGLAERTAAISLPTEKILFSQNSVNQAEFKTITASMGRSGWQGPPIDVVELANGQYGALDNTRVLAAHTAGIEVKAVVHAPTDLLTESEAARFATEKNKPTTWGEAYKARIQNQNAGFRKANPNGSRVTSATGTGKRN